MHRNNDVAVIKSLQGSMHRTQEVPPCICPEYVHYSSPGNYPRPTPLLGPLIILPISRDRLQEFMLYKSFTLTEHYPSRASSQHDEGFIYTKPLASPKNINFRINKHVFDGVCPCLVKAFFYMRKKSNNILVPFIVNLLNWNEEKRNKIKYKQILTSNIHVCSHFEFGENFNRTIMG